MKKISSKAALSKFGVAFITSLLVIVFTQDFLIPITPLKRLEQKFIDFRFQERGKISFKDSSDVIILEITQDSYDQIPSPYNSWPWPRNYFAKVIENLNEAGAKAIGIDIVMSNKDQFSEVNDSILFRTIEKYENVVLAGKINIDAESTVERGGDSFLIRNINENFANLFYEADSSIGIVQAVSDNDGVYRRYIPYVYSAAINRKIPSFAYALLNKYFGKESSYVAKKVRGEFLYNDVEVPEYSESTILVNYYGPSGTFPRVKFIDVLDDKEFHTVDEIDFETGINTWDNPDYGLKHSGKFKDKIVLIGSTMPEDKDLVPVSFSDGTRDGDNLLYGVEYHANAVQNFIDRNFIYSIPNIYIVLGILFLTTGMFFLTSYVKSIKQVKTYLIETGFILFVILSIAAIYQISFLFFESNNLIFPVVAPSMAIVFGYVGSTIFEFFAERKKSTMMKGMFSQYVSTNLVNELIANPDKLRLGGEKKNLTILFSDIAGFTSFSEGKTAGEVVTFINEFLDEMSESVLMFNGTLDKYLGDSVMAFWGAPIELKNHAELACKCAIDMKKRLDKLNKKWSGKSGSIKMRIGINTGEVVVGNIGGKKRFDYTVMGDNVNLASRLEGANKVFGTSIMINESTFNEINDEFIVRQIDNIRVKGKKSATKVFELIDNKKDELIENFNLFSLGLTEYQKGNFEKALTHFTEQYKKDEDSVSKLYISRCENLLVKSPDEWDGITTLTEK